MPRAPLNVLVFPFRESKDGSLEFALFRRSDDGFWQPISGGGEDGEAPIEAARREAFEEATMPQSAKYFMLKTAVSIPVSAFEARHLWPKDQYVILGHYFAVEAHEIEIVLSYEHTEYRWVSYQQGRDLLYWHHDQTALWELNERLLNDDLPLPL